MKNKTTRGYTLIELMVAVGLFGLIMTLASGAYLVLINVSRQTQAAATGIDNLSFALETMVRTIRTSSDYCTASCGPSYFSMTDPSHATVTYRFEDGAITQNGEALTDPSVHIVTLSFTPSGTTRGDGDQPHVTIVVSGTVDAGHGKTQTFTLETAATMRGTDL